MVAVPNFIRANARRGLDLLEYRGEGLKPATVREARQMSAGNVSADKVRRMAAWFARHTPDLSSPDAKAYVAGDKDRPTAGQVAWLLWGGSLGDDKFDAMKWAERKRDQLIEAGELSKELDDEPATVEAMMPMSAPAATNTDLVSALKEMLANVVAFYAAAHRAHWNVTGADFREYHGLFADIYEDAYDSIDPFAENIRKMRGFPMTWPAMLAEATVKDDSETTDARELAADLLSKNATVTAMLKATFNIANDANEQGVANFVAERIDQHEKWDWQLSASIA